MPAERIDISSGDAYQRARRRLYAERNAATLARLNRRAARDRELEEILETAEQSVINVFDPRESENLDHHHQHQQDEHHHEAGNVGGQGGVDDDDAEWVTLEEDQPDEVDLAIASEKARRQQQAKEVNWKTLTALLHPIYMKLRNATQNWTASNSYDTFTACPETCLRKKNRQVDLIDVHRQRRSIIQFCECTKDGVRLLQHGYLAGSPVKPVTAFSLPLLILHNCLWNNCNVNALPFTNALTQWLEPRSQRLRTKGGKHARQLRKPFTAVVDLFRLLEDMTTEVVHSILKLTNQQILAWTSCPACFGPSSLNSTQYSDLMKTDSNFASMETSSTDIKAKLAAITNGSVPLTDRCTDAHKAANDKQNESTWKGCDDTGLMGCCCRHDTVVHLANIFKSGEQRQFPMALIKRVLADIEPDRPVGFLYDIGCSMDKYINIRRLIPQDRPRIKFATLVFHAYAHNWACQLDYHPRFNESWGLSDGEGLERLWSYLSPLVSPLRYATRNHRLAAIAHRTKHHNERSIVQLAYWMRRKFTRALKRRQEWEAQRQFSQEHATGEDDRRKRLVALYKRQETLDILRASLQDESIFLLSPDRARAVVAAIVDAATFIQTETVELTRSGDLDVTDPEEQKVRLLVWDAKSALYAEAVYLQAESQPLRDPHLMGSHLGTHGKEKVTRAINARDASGKLLVEAFNREYQIFKDNYTDARFTHSHIHPLTYKEFKKFPLDHHFWNDELYYHSTAPWSIDPDVREGINGVLLLQRIKEEFELIAQEVACSMGWAIALHHDICTIITQARSSINLLNNNGTPDLTFIDYVQLGDFSPVEKLRVIGEELQTRLLAHQTLVEEWSPDIEWLWNRCQPLENRGRISEWHALMTEVQRHIPQEFPAPAEVEGAVEGIDDALEQQL
ncbi:hypothetical protein PSTT_05128 [Puccinia striiformis]|uniref:CxC1-like cysteine cluster associated with KDZ transposases domain-containing protein n=1 Tax=Puccinia striiformis TaxID=27350 RepID=A0A2S4VQC0_9BASI|nr:hypothetical protein PSTT_05128 [Puccinia striiformis]